MRNRGQNTAENWLHTVSEHEIFLLLSAGMGKLRLNFGGRVRLWVKFGVGVRVGGNWGWVFRDIKVVVRGRI